MVKIIINDIRSLKREVRIQLEQRKSGDPSDTAAGELKAILLELEAIEDQILYEPDTNRVSHYEDLYRTVSEAWEIDSELGDKLLDFTNKYKEFI